MAYGTVSDLRGLLSQVPNTSGNDLLLQQLLDRATSIVETYMGFSYTTAWAAASQRTVFSQGDGILTLPAHKVGTVTQITTMTGVVVDPLQYSQPGADGQIHHVYLMPGLPTSGWTITMGGWDYNNRYHTGRYLVTAVWGYGPPPLSVVQVALELAKELWFDRDAKGASDIVGIEGAGGVAVGYKGALTNRQKMILDSEITQYAGGPF